MGRTYSLTHCIRNYINICVENTVPTRKVWCFSNDNPWVTPELKTMLNKRKRVFNSVDKEEQKRIQLCGEILHIFNLSFSLERVPDL